MFARLVVEELRTAVPALAPMLRAEPLNADPRPGAKPADAIVAVDGSGTHLTVQAAIDAAPVRGTMPFVILVKPGVYREHLLVPEEKPFILLRGEAAEAAATVISLGTNLNSVGADGKKIATPESATVLVRAADFTAENLTFENTTTPDQHVQALAFYITGDRGVLRRCRFLGWQDTLRPDAPRLDEGKTASGPARQYFVECTIAGHVDFIYAAGTAVFDRCQIQVLGDGYITAASTPPTAPFGFVFLDCRVTAAPGVKRTYLGRPWRDYAAVAFLRTELPAVVPPAGWHNWNRPEAEKTARYAEYKNTGPGANPAARVPWSRQLTDEEAKSYTIANILGGADHWDPTVQR
jgi:pectinesterase